MGSIVRSSLFVTCIGIINLASAIGIPARGDVVTDWNNAALDAIRAGRTAPPIASRSLAILHAAIYDAVHSIINRSVENGETTGRNWRCSSTGSNRIERCVVPVRNDIATGRNTDGGSKINDADTCYEKRTSDDATHNNLLK